MKLIIDNWMVEFAAVARLAINGPMIAVGEPPSPPPYHARHPRDRLYRRSDRLRAQSLPLDGAYLALLRAGRRPRPFSRGGRAPRHDINSLSGPNLPADCLNLR